MNCSKPAPRIEVILVKIESGHKPLSTYTRGQIFPYLLSLGKLCASQNIITTIQ